MHCKVGWSNDTDFGLMEYWITGLMDQWIFGVMD
jgi:hypothetical protein